MSLHSTTRVLNLNGSSICRLSMMSHGTDHGGSQRAKSIPLDLDGPNVIHLVRPADFNIITECSPGDGGMQIRKDTLHELLDTGIVADTNGANCLFGGMSGKPSLHGAWDRSHTNITCFTRTRCPTDVPRHTSSELELEFRGFVLQQKVIIFQWDAVGSYHQGVRVASQFDSRVSHSSTGCPRGIHLQIQCNFQGFFTA